MSLSQRDVEQWMIAAERADPRTRNEGEARPSTWPRRFVVDRDQRRALELWVWCEAHGYAFYAICKRRRHPYTTWLRRKNQAVERITMLLALENSMTRSEGLFAAAG